MGRVMRFSCNDCGYKKEVFSGSGMRDFSFEKQKELFNCPGCGCTRALAALLHGDIHKCFTSNILFIPSILVAVILLLFPKLMKIRCLIWTIITIVVLFFILRNLPWQPFCLLAPH